MPLYPTKKLLDDLQTAGVGSLVELANLLQQSEPTPGVGRSPGVEDRVVNFQGQRYRIIARESWIPDLGGYWAVIHFRPYP